MSLLAEREHLVVVRMVHMCKHPCQLLEDCSDSLDKRWWEIASYVGDMYHVSKKKCQEMDFLMGVNNDSSMGHQLKERDEERKPTIFGGEGVFIVDEGLDPVHDKIDVL